jgi:ubiquinone/menaquinone biosynthesis C-methylase UbiE
MKREQLEKYLRWDADTWGIGLQYILGTLQSGNNKKALELGCNYGGMSVCLLHEKNYSIICSDIEDPSEKVINEHPEIKNNKNLTFDIVDGLNIKYADNSFDLIIFKSVLGHITPIEKQQQFINEIYRVLKPGGFFCFLENSKASQLHQFARKNFVKWGNSWRYITIDEMKKFLTQFKSIDVKASGFFTAFVKSGVLHKLAYTVDKICLPFIPLKMRYVLYGIAIK